MNVADRRVFSHRHRDILVGTSTVPAGTPNADVMMNAIESLSSTRMIDVAMGRSSMRPIAEGRARRQEFAADSTSHSTQILALHILSFQGTTEQVPFTLRQAQGERPKS